MSKLRSFGTMFGVKKRKAAIRKDICCRTVTLIDLLKKIWLSKKKFKRYRSAASTFKFENYDALRAAWVAE